LTFPSKKYGPIKLSFRITHHIIRLQRCWWSFVRNQCGFSTDQ